MRPYFQKLINKLNLLRRLDIYILNKQAKHMSDLLVSGICDILKGRVEERGCPTHHRKGDFSVGDLVSVVFLGKRHNGVVVDAYDMCFVVNTGSKDGTEIVVPYISGDAGPIHRLEIDNDKEEAKQALKELKEKLLARKR